MTPCPLCATPAPPFVRAPDRNRRVSDHRFTYARCPACATVFLTDPPADLGRYYPESYYALPAADAESETEQAKVALLREYTAPGRLVEIGPGPGGFAAEAKRQGFSVTGIEMDARACRHLRDVLGVEAIESDVPHVALRELAEPADAIVLWHVLEHLEEPVALLEAAAARLAPGGVLLIAVPNPEAFQFRVLRSRWPHLDAPRHRSLIPAATLTEHARASGLERVGLTTADRAGTDWNVFGWQHTLVRPGLGRRRQRAAFYAGALTAAALAPVERRGLAGSTYTAVFRQTGGA